MVELFWLLLPIAAGSGWYLGRRELGRRPRREEPGSLPTRYVKGLNYLLSEQQDKAIEVFIEMLDVDSDTVETHLALGNLFRRQGEVDRAIRIHQNLIARPSLSRQERAYALLELGHDYMKAGLLDRAESLFLQVVRADSYVEAALGQLLIIYQREQEWESAIEVGFKLERFGGRSTRPLVAQFYCEQAEQARAAREFDQARTLLKQALGQDPDCVRASLLQGDLERERGNPKAALKAYMRVKHQDVDYLPEALDSMGECYRASGDKGGLIVYLREVLAEHPAVMPALALAEELRRTQGARAAMDFLTDHLQRSPSVPGLAHLLSLYRDSGGDSQRDLDVLAQLFTDLLRDRPGYECRQCGFSAKTLYWHCPSCRSWSTVKPLIGVAGE